MFVNKNLYPYGLELRGVEPIVQRQVGKFGGFGGGGRK